MKHRKKSCSKTLPTIEVDDFERVLSLSPMQRDLSVESLVRPAGVTNNLGCAVRIHSPLNISLWRQAIQIVSDSQTILRAVFLLDREKDDMTESVHLGIRPSFPVHLQVEDYSTQPLSSAALQKRIHATIYAPYQLVEGELVRYVLIKQADDSFVSIFAMHHILIDGVGFVSLLDAVCQHYELLVGQRQSAFLPEDLFPDYLQKAMLYFDRPPTVDFWQKRLSAVDPLSFGFSATEEAGPNHKVSKSLWLSEPHWLAISSFCRKNRITPAIYFKCLFGIMIYTYCRAEGDFIVSEVQAGRPRGHAESIGCYFQQVPFVFPFTLLQGERQIEEMFDYARDFHYRIKEFSNISILAQRRLLSEGGLGFMYNFIHFYPTLEFLNKTEQVEQYMNDVEGQVQFVPKLIDGRLQLNLYYFSDDFQDHDFLQRINALSQQIIAGVSSLGLLDLISAQEANQQLFRWNETQVDYPKVALVNDLLQRQVQITPDAPAVRDAQHQLSYVELDAKSNQLAHYLRDRGVDENSRVAVFMERSVWMVVALVGIIKSGAAYVPIDPEFPSDRVAYMLKDSDSHVVLTQSNLFKKINYSALKEIVCLDSQFSRIKKSPESPPQIKTKPDHIFSILYTSGSTGRPKGVMNTHPGIINRLQWMQAEYQLTYEDHVLQKTPYTFDVSMWEFFWPLMTGALLVMARPGGHKDPDYLNRVIRQQRITTLHFVPSMLNIFLQNIDSEKCEPIRRVICSGEALTLEHESLFFERLPKSELHNLYGPTEASIDVTYWQCQPKHNLDTVPIGRPIANTKVYVVDPVGRLIPQGVVGELCLSGVCLAKGYLNKPELTDASFVHNPFSTEASYHRLYKTGDLVRFTPTGVLEYLGRKDTQVKIRGHRIETSEIESVIREIRDVQEVAVVAKDDGDDSKKLLAFVLPYPGHSFTATDFRDYLKDRLPEYMIPSVYLTVNQMPFTTSGKLDRRQLLELDSQPLREHEYVRPNSQTEQRLAEIWSDLLNIEAVSAQDHFFHIGGHSLSAIRLVGRIRETFEIDVPLETIFARASLREMAESIDVLVKLSEQSVALANSTGRVEVEI